MYVNHKDVVFVCIKEIIIYLYLLTDFLFNPFFVWFGFMTAISTSAFIDMGTSTSRTGH